MRRTVQSGTRDVSLYAVDWGTSSCRVWALDASGAVIAGGTSDQGTLAVAQSVAASDADGRARAFEDEFFEIAGESLAANPGVPVLACGMVGSSLGWKEAQYIELPIGVDITRDLLVHVNVRDGRDLWILPGLHADGRGPGGYPDVIRGEETQLIGILARLGSRRPDGDLTIVLPGTHTKWVRVQGSVIDHFTTVMTGEFYSLLRKHSILGEPATHTDQFHRDAFLRGLDLSLDPDSGPLAAKAFAARTLGLDRSVSPEEIEDLLSGLLIGDEVGRELAHYPSDPPIVLCGADALTERYAVALAHAGAQTTVITDDVTVEGLIAVAHSTGIAHTPAAASAHANGSIANPSSTSQGEQTS